MLGDCREVKDDNILPLFFLGRPLWRATWEKMKVTPLELINFARKKLYGELRDPDRSDLAARLTPFAVCANLKVSPVSALSGDFVASHLATLVGVSEDRTALYIRYPSEPILAEVALTSIGGMSMSDWIGDMNDLTKLFVQGSGAGDRGDFIGLLLQPLGRCPMYSNVYAVRR